MELPSPLKIDFYPDAFGRMGVGRLKQAVCKLAGQRMLSKEILPRRKIITQARILRNNFAVVYPSFLFFFVIQLLARGLYEVVERTSMSAKGYLGSQFLVPRSSAELTD